MKKTLAILLSLALVICMIPATASVAFATTTYSIKDDYVKTFEFNGSPQAPSVQVQKTEGDVTTDVTQGITLKYKVRGSEDTTATMERPTDAGNYTIIAVIEDGGSCRCDFEITAYNLINHNASATIGRQISGSSGLDLSSLVYYVDGSPATGELLVALNAYFEPKKVDGKNEVSFSKKAGAKDNFTGEIKNAPYTEGTNINNKAGDVSINDKIEYGGDVKDPNSFVTITGLNNGIDFDVTCNETIKDAKTYNIVINGKGSYAGKIEGKQVTVASRDAKNVNIGTIPKYVEGKFSAETIKKDVKLTDLGKTLEPGKDYNVSTIKFVKTKDSTTDYYKVYFNFVNNYSNYGKEIFKEFEVGKAAYDISQVVATLTKDSVPWYNGNYQPASVTVKKADGTPFSSSYYTLSYRYEDAKGIKYDIPSPIDARTYEVYIVGRSPYAGEKKVGNYTIPQYDMQYVTVSVSMASAASVPNVTVRSAYENIDFVKDKDYTVSYTVLASSGKVQVTVKPTLDGNLKGSQKTDLYPITAKSIASCSVSFTNGRSSAAYTGSAIPIDVTVKDGYYTTLTKGTHYTVTYKDAAGKTVSSIRDAGTYTIEIKGIGGYTGTTYLTFTVTGTDISGYTVTLKEASVNATGYAQTPVITSVKKGYYYSLTSNDYTVSYQDSNGKTVTSMSAPGTYKVVVTGKNGYSGSTYATFRIVGLPQTVTVTQDSYKVYATSDSFKITAKASGDATGFTYTSSNPAVASVSAAGYVTMHKVGRAVITVTATGMKKYEPAYETVEVKVYPKKAVMTKKPWTDGKKYQAKVRWTYQDGATSYQVRYSRDKNFGAGTYKTKTVKAHGKDYTTQSTTLKSLKSKSTYYIKVRAVYTDPVTGDTYYGAWSGWRSVKTK